MSGQDQNKHWKAADLNDLHEVLNTLFQSHSLHECDAQLWDLLAAALSSDDSDNWDKKDRGNVIFFCKNLAMLINTVFRIHEQNKSV